MYKNLETNQEESHLKDLIQFNNMTPEHVTDDVVLPYLGPTPCPPPPPQQRHTPTKSHHRRVGSIAIPAPEISSNKKLHLESLTKSLVTTQVSEWNSAQVQAFFYFNGSANINSTFKYLTGSLLLKVTEKDLRTNGIKNEAQIKSILKSLQVLKEKKIWDISDHNMWSSFRCTKWLVQWGVEHAIAEEFCVDHFVFGALLKDFSSKYLTQKLNLKGVQHIKARLIVDMMNFPSFFERNGSWVKMSHREVACRFAEIGYPTHVVEAFSSNRIEGCLLKWINIREFGFSHYITRGLEFAIQAIIKNEIFLNVDQILANYDKIKLGEEGRRAIQEKCIHGAYFIGMDNKEFVGTFNLSDPLRLERLLQVRKIMLESPLKRLDTEMEMVSFYEKTHMKNHCWICCDKFVSHKFEPCGCLVVCEVCAMSCKCCPKCNQENHVDNYDQENDQDVEIVTEFNLE